MRCSHTHLLMGLSVHIRGVGQGQMRCERLRFKLHSSSYIWHTLCIYIDCHTVEAEELSFGLGSDLIGCTVSISSRLHGDICWRKGTVKLKGPISL